MSPANTRRCPRHQVNLPVRIAPGYDTAHIAAPGLATEISQSGMALYGGIELQPGDLMEIEFQVSNHLRVAGVVRNRMGYCFGLEFLAPQAKPCKATSAPAIEAPSVQRPDEELLEIFLQQHAAYLRQKELEIRRLRQEMLKTRQTRLQLQALHTDRATR